MSLDFSLYLKTDTGMGEEDWPVFDRNITHNLGRMASKAGIYKELWRPSEIGATLALDIIYGLEIGLKKLKDKPDYFRKFSAPNGWGTYHGFLKFVEAVLEACREYPNALIHVWR